MKQPVDDFEFEDDCMGEDPDFDDDEFFDCHMGSDGYCGAAGSEDCEFECPIMADLRRKERKRAEERER
jgi:hypothetical protein